MNRTAMLSIGTAILIMLSGCLNLSMRTNTQAPSISDEAVPRLHIEQPVAFRNAAPSSGDIVIGEYSNWTIYADLHKYTESSIAAAKNVLERRSIRVKDDADKVLELSVYRATSEQGAFIIKETAVLRVRTGDGLEKEFEGIQRHGNTYGTTPAMERALAHSVAQMFNDEEILKYLEN